MNKESKENKENKKNGICLQIKKEIIDKVEANVSYDLIMEQYALKNKSNISQIIKNKGKYLAAYNESLSSPLRKTLKSTKFKQIDNGLKAFIANCNQSGAMVNDRMLKEKALEIATVTNVTNFKASNTQRTLNF